LLRLHGRRSATTVLLLFAAVKAATASASATATTASTAAGRAFRAELLGLGLVVAAGEEAATASTSAAATAAVATTASTAAVHALGRRGHERDAGVAADEARLRLRWVAADETLLRLRWVADDLDGIAVAALVEVTTTTEEGGGRERGERSAMITHRPTRTRMNVTPAKWLRLRVWLTPACRGHRGHVARRRDDHRAAAGSPVP
jgi:hypothetical protein